MKTNRKLSWTTVQRKVNDLVPQTINPRKISEKQISDLKKSLKKFNLVEIPAIDLDGKILAGHQRCRILKLVGRGEEIIDVRIPNRKLTEQEAKEYLISSNALGGDWDFDLLKSFDLEMLLDVGFDEIKLSKFWDKDKEIKKEEFDVASELQKIKNPKTKLGDVIYLGKHKLICGDGTDPNTVKKLVGDLQVDMINQDPPFNINLSYKKGVGGKKSKKNYGGEVKDNLSDENYKMFLHKMLVNALSVLKEDAHIFYWCDERYVWLIQTLYNELKIKNKRLCIWLKNNSSPTPQVAFNKVTEFCCYGTIGSPYLADDVNNLNEIINPDVTTGNQMFEDIQNIFLNKRLPANKYSHPTEKPPELHHKVLKRCSKLSGLVLDLTAGSGSILIACEQLGRVAYVNELNPIFCDLIIKRWEDFTNKKAVYENK